MAEGALRPGWTRVAFGDVVKLTGERSSSPRADGFERFVGLDHLDAGDLTIRRWGDVSDGSTFTTIFRPGHVLFGKRRAYQRKAAVAQFSGVCSGDIYVLEPRDGSLLRDLLPYICQTDEFFEHAVHTSAGSLSPRTNWGSMASYEFNLPPLSEQRRMADALSAIRTGDEKLLGAINSATALFAALLEHNMRSAGATMVALGDIAIVERGKFSHRPRNLPQFFGGDADFVQTGDVAASRGTLGPASQTLSELGKQYSRAFPPGTILITIAAVIGATAVADRWIWCPDSVVGVSPHQGVVDPRFLELALRRLRPVLDQHEATSSTQKNINLAVLRPLPIPLFPFADQLRIVEDLARVERAARQLEERRAELRDFPHLILNPSTREQ